MSQKKNSTRQKGKMGEDIACRYLEEKGFTILDRNYKFEHAELDIVAYQGRFIIFVEVKTRSSKSFGEPEESIDEKKKEKLLHVAEAWMYERRMTGAPARFDVISIVYPATSKEEIRHYEEAFWYL